MSQEIERLSLSDDDEILECPICGAEITSDHRHEIP